MFWYIVNRRNILLFILLVILSLSYVSYREFNIIQDLKTELVFKNSAIKDLNNSVKLLKDSYELFNKSITQTDKLLTDAGLKHKEISFSLDLKNRRIMSNPESYVYHEDSNRKLIKTLNPEAIDSISLNRIYAMWDSYCLGASKGDYCGKTNLSIAK